MNPFRGRFLFGFAMTLAALIAAGGGYYLLRYQAWTAYRNWSIGRMNGMARDFIAANDSRNALLTVRKVLSSRPNDAEAWKLGVTASDQANSNEAVLFQRNLCRIQKTTANYVELMRLSLKYQAYSYGVDAINAVAQDARQLPDYHRMAAEIYRRVHRDLPAKYHLLSLLSLEPGDTAAQLALAEIEFEISPKKLPADWAERVKILAESRETKLAATLLQMREAVVRGSANEAAALAVKLQSHPDLTLTQRIGILQAAYLYDPRLATELLGKLEQKAADNPLEVVQVMGFLSGDGRDDAVQAWYPELPEVTKEDERVKFAAAQSLLSLKDWPALEAILRGTPWKNDEHLRMALLAYVYRMTGRQSDFAESWKIAMISAGQDPRKITRLLQNAEKWKWENERYELLWKLFNQMPTNAAIQKFLVAREYHDGNTVNLNKLYARVMEADPRDDEARNNFAYTSLLMDTNSGRAQMIARDLFAKDPENVSYRTTYAMALYRQGQAKEALALVEQLDPASRLAPVQMVHEAAYAAAVGQLDRAAALLPELTTATLLPEQRRLIDVARTEIARRQTTRGKQTELVSMVGESGAAGDGWLALLPAKAANASLDFKLSDSYYREKNFTAMRELLRGARWQENDYLRYALLSFAERAESRDDRAGDQWRQAFLSAGRDADRLRDLEILASKWGWTAEQMDVMAKRFEREASNREMLAKLLDYYRSNLRTADMARVLWLYVNQTNATGTEAALCVYYSLLCGLNESPAQTLAAKVYDKAPEQARPRVAYAFALWRQRRAGEALKLIQGVDALDLTGMQASLVEAGILLDLGRKEEAKKILEGFTAANAMPEEKNLAATLFRQAGLPNAVTALTLQQMNTLDKRHSTSLGYKTLSFDEFVSPIRKFTPALHTTHNDRSTAS